MEHRDLAVRIGDRIAGAGLTASSGVQAALGAYLELLAHWNQRINLTAYALAPVSDEAIDRLIVEPIAAASKIDSGDRLLIDIGSGGGSPALPLRIARPHLRVVLVESKVRKCAFLREAVRRLGLEGVEVENHRIEELLVRGDLLAAADVVTMRAVRADEGMWTTAQAFMRPGGRMFWFTTAANSAGMSVRPPVVVESVENLSPAVGGCLAIFRKEK